MFHSAQKKAFVGLAVSTSLLALSAPAYAQLDEIVVTAQKKSQSLQDVPIAIQAFDLESLETNRIEGLEDIAVVTPNVYVTQNPADPNGVRISIRGVGTFDPQIGQDSRIAIYQDGVYQGRTQGLAVDYPDLERVEILKGPQGTLYGRNSVGGAINLISAKPLMGEYTGKVTAEYGNFNHKKLSGAINVPLGESVAARVSGLWLDRDGWVENNGPGTDFAGEDKIGVRGALGIDITDDLNFEIAGDYNTTKKEPVFYQSVTGFGAGLFAPAIQTFEGRQEEATTSFTNEKGKLVTQGVSGTLNYSGEPGSTVSDMKLTVAYREAQSSRLVTLIPTANPAVINQIVGGFNRALAPLPFAFGATQQPLRPDFGSAFTGDPAERGLFLSPPGGSTNLDGHEQLSAEVTFNGESSNGKVEYTLGGFYFDEKTGTGPGRPNLTQANDYLFVLGQFDPRLTAPNVRGFIGSLDAASGQDPRGPVSFPAGSDGPVPAAGILLGVLGGQFLPADGSVNPFGAFPLLAQLVGNGTTCGAGDVPMPANNFCIPTLSVGLGSARQSASNTLQIDTTALALYGQMTYSFSDDLRLTLGARYSDESKDGVGQAKSPFFNDNIDLTGNVIESNIGSYSDSIFDPAATLEYDLNEDVMLYASYKQAFRSGGFNSAAVGLRLPGETYGPDFLFDREDMVAYEGGFKGTFGGALRVNAAGFFYDFTNKQTTVALDPIVATSRAIVNTDEEMWGFEVDAQYAVNDDITLRGGYGYVDGDAGDVVNPLTQQVEVRDELQGTPKNSFNVAVDYNGDLGGNELFANLTYAYKDKILSIPQNDLYLPSFGLVNGRIGVNVDSMGAPVTVSLWGTNLLDEEYLIDSLPFDTFAYRTVVYGQPRSFGVSVGHKF